MILLRKVLSVLFALALVLSYSPIVSANHSGDLDCSDFQYWEDAQEHLKNHPGDPDGLDRDGDGIACDSLPRRGSDNGGSQPPSQQPPSNKVTATVVEVVDGDTIKVKLNGKTETVRMLLIDTPETVHPTVPDEPCGPEASSFTKKMLPKGTKVTLEFDKDKRDKYGRLLAYVYKGGKSIQEALLAAGLAEVVVYQPNDKYEEKYRAIEAKAKKAKKGIWSDNPCGKKDDGKKDDGQNDNGNKGSDGDKESDNKGGTITPPKSGGESGGQSGTQTGGKMPKTATPYPTYALFGAGILAAGVGLLIYRRRAA